MGETPMNITGMINDTTVWGTSSSKSKPQSTIRRHIYTYKQEVRISATPSYSLVDTKDASIAFKGKY